MIIIDWLMKNYYSKVLDLIKEIKNDINEIVSQKRIINIPYYYDEDFEHGVQMLIDDGYSVFKGDENNNLVISVMNSFTNEVQEVEVLRVCKDGNGRIYIDSPIDTHNLDDVNDVLSLACLHAEISRH